MAADNALRDDTDKSMSKWLSVLFFIFLPTTGARAQQAVPAPSAPAKPAASAATNPEFLRAADEVLAQVSKILDLPLKEPLKKSIRTRQELHEYLVREANDDKDQAQRYADQKAMEAFGLIPRDFPLDSFLIDLLTDQVEGLYDSKTKEFYIADWISPDDQTSVMAHELTHALHDQYFHIEQWAKAARPNDDAEDARDAVIEGSALAAMLDYMLADRNITVRDLPDVSSIINGQAVGEMDKDPLMQKAPPYIRDELVFPYLAGTIFTQQFLKANSGWKDFKKVYENPPVSTQQILHPELYLAGVQPLAVTLPVLDRAVSSDWKMLEENTLGEFGLQEVLKQFLGAERAGKMSPAWAGDHYAVLEKSDKKETMLILRLRLDNDADAAQFFSEYSDALQAKYKTHSPAIHHTAFLSFQTDQGGVFLRCAKAECLTLQGGDRAAFDKISAAIGWTAISEAEPQPVPGVALRSSVTAAPAPQPVL
jgi:hypothetical protein